MILGLSRKVTNLGPLGVFNLDITKHMTKCSSSSIDEDSFNESTTASTAIRKAALGLKGVGKVVAKNGFAAFSMVISNQVIGAQSTGYVPTGASQVSATRLSTVATAVRRYSVSCYDDGSGAPVLLRARVQGQTSTAGFLVKITVEKDGVTQGAINPKNGKGLNFSPYAAVSKGPGNYTITISKVKKKASDPDKKLQGAMIFQTRQECDNAAGGYTGITTPVEIR